MKSYQKIIAAVCASSVALSLAGCSDISVMGTVDGETINAGVYLYYATNARQEAQTEVNEQLSEMGTDPSEIENFDYFDYKVGEKEFSQYVNDRAMDSVKQYVAILRRCAELEIGLTADEEQTIKDSAKELWNTEITYYGYPTGVTYGESYEQAGISRQSYIKVQQAAELGNKLFDAYYDEGGITETDEKDIEVYYTDNYGRFQIIQVSLTDGEGDKLETDEAKKDYMELAESYLERLENGEDFDVVYHDYENFVEELKASASDDKDTSSEAEEDEDEEKDEPTSDDTSSGSDDTTSDDEDEEEEHDHEMLLAKDSTSPDEATIKWLFELDENEGGIYDKDEDYYYVAMRKPLLDRDDWYEENRLDILHEMKDEEFEEILLDFAKDYEVNFSDAALNAYKPENLR